MTSKTSLQLYQLLQLIIRLCIMNLSSALYMQVQRMAETY